MEHHFHFLFLTAEPSVDLDSVLLVRRGTTVSPWHAWRTLHKVRIAWSCFSCISASAVSACGRTNLLKAQNLNNFEVRNKLYQGKYAKPVNLLSL